MPGHALTRDQIKFTYRDTRLQHKDKKEINCSPKKNYLPEQCDLTFEDILSSMKEICVEEESIIFIAEAKTFEGQQYNQL